MRTARESYTPAEGSYRMAKRAVLLATDGSPEAVRASRMAIELSNEIGLALHVVHVAPTHSGTHKS
jgi:nucleotide-binding universal stress UspA family protein